MCLMNCQYGTHVTVYCPRPVTLIIEGQSGPYNQSLVFVTLPTVFTASWDYSEENKRRQSEDNANQLILRKLADQLETKNEQKQLVQEIKKPKSREEIVEENKKYLEKLNEKRTQPMKKGRNKENQGPSDKVSKGKSLKSNKFNKRFRKTKKSGKV